MSERVIPGRGYHQPEHFESPYVDRHGDRLLSDEEAQRVGVQPHPEARRMIYEAAMADDLFSGDELEEYVRSITTSMRRSHAEG